MLRRIIAPGALVAYAPWVFVLTALVVPWGRLGIDGDASALGPLGWWAFIALAVCGSLAALFRYREECRLGLASVVLPVGVAFGGPAVAVALGLSALTVAEAARRNRWGRVFRTARPVAMRDFVRAGGRVGTATLAAALLWWWGGGSSSSPVGLSVATLGYFATTALLDQWALSRGETTLGAQRRLMHYGLELAAWGWGLALVAVIAGTGWPIGLALLALTALLAVELARQAGLRSRAEYRLRQLKTVSEASRRMVSQDVRPAGIADRVVEECRKVVDFEWFHFELLTGDESPVSWYAEFDGPLRRGIPEPAASPKPLPGFHRRQSWHTLQRLLEADGIPLGRLTLWCHPRRVDERSEELFEALCFQLTDSIQRSVLHQQANRDPLTGLGDRRALERRLEQLYEMCKAEGLPMAIVMLDIDHFKQINDTYGHGAGDVALVEVSQLLASHGRERDLCCRYGGEEFILLLEAMHGRKGLFIADRIRQVVENHAFEFEGVHIPLRLSAGVASFPEVYVAAGQDLVLLADTALYEAKRRGRNRALLNLGDKRYLNAAGRALGGRRRAKPEPAPRLFS